VGLILIWNYLNSSLIAFSDFFIIGLITFLGLTSFTYYVYFIFSYLSKKVSLSFSFLWSNLIFSFISSNKKCSSKFWSFALFIWINFSPFLKCPSCYFSDGFFILKLQKISKSYWSGCFLAAGYPSNINKLNGGCMFIDLIFKKMAYPFSNSSLKGYLV